MGCDKTFWSWSDELGQVVLADAPTIFSSRDDQGYLNSTKGLQTLDDEDAGNLLDLYQDTEEAAAGLDAAGEPAK